MFARRLILASLLAFVGGCADNADPVSCETDDECGSAYYCKSGTCVFRVDDNGGDVNEGCKSDLDCTDPARPQCKMGICLAPVTVKECTQNADCKDASKPECKANVCVAADGNPSNGEETPKCGDGKVNGEEVCDYTAAITATCSDYDNTKTWQEGGKPGCSRQCMLTAGSCIEKSSVVTGPYCGDGFVNNEEICDPQAAMTLTCADFDNTKIWRSGGTPGCSRNCELTQGTCLEKTCGNGSIDIGETCEIGKEITATCKDYNSVKQWKAGGKPGCSENCQLSQGTCVEDLCGNGTVDTGEECDFGRDGSGNVKTTIACDTIPGFYSGNATCTNACKNFNTGSCQSHTQSGLYYCQMVKPVTVQFTPDVNSVTLNGRVAFGGLTDKTPANDGGIEAQLIYGKDYTKIGDWRSVTATPDESFAHDTTDAYTAILTRDQFLAMDSEQVFYTFRFRKAGTNVWSYCKIDKENPDIINSKIGFIEVADDAEMTSNANINEVGIATGSSVTTNDVIANFTFDSHTTGENDNQAVYSPEEGTGKISGRNKMSCVSSCFATDGKKGMAWNVQGWVGSVDKKNEAVASGARIFIDQISTVGMQDIGLDFRVWRNNASASPTRIVVRYSTDNITYKEIRDIALNTEQIKKFYDYSVVFNSDADNQPALFIELIPYGGNGATRFDDIKISQNHSY